MATISVVVPAAGCGARANLNGNKVLAPLCGQPLLWHTLRALLSTQEIAPLEVILVARRNEWDEIRGVLSLLDAELWRVSGNGDSQGQGIFIRIVEGVDRWPITNWNQGRSQTVRLVEGGATRQDSVEAGANAAAGDYVLVHDAARPLLSAQLMARVVEAAIKSGAAIAALPACDTIKRAARDDSQQIISETLPREEIWLAQTPQVFRREILLHALQEARRDNFSGTDCASLVERLRDENGAALYSVVLVPGEERNFKVTFAADLERAASLLKDGNRLSQ